MKKKWLIYGANGYTGQLIARQARQQGLKPILAGRSNEGIAAIAAETGFDSLVFDLDDTAELNRALKGISLVLHCAGPFSATSILPVKSASLRMHTSNRMRPRTPISF